MTKAEETVINNRMIFYFGLAMIYGVNLIFADNLSDLLQDFANMRTKDLYNELSLIYVTRYKNHVITYTEPAELKAKTIECFKDIDRNFNNIVKYYDKVSYSDVDRLSHLASEFSSHLDSLGSVKHELLPQ